MQNEPNRSRTPFQANLAALGVLFVALPLTVWCVSSAVDVPVLEALLAKEIIGPRQTLRETQEYLESRVPRMPVVKTAAEWEEHASRLRAEMLQKVVFRGEAINWLDAPAKVEWLETIPGDEGYRIKKLRYEALPGLWIPALLYEPAKLEGKTPAVLNVNGHDANGKAAVYKQIRCINLAKRGLLALNIEWLGMGQLRGPGYAHGRMNQLDLCGTSGLAPFYLNMSRGLDVLLTHAHADPERVAVTGLSGGGWQTIYLSALDPRVKLTCPVAGYSGFRTRIRHHKDLGDSEQTPCDMATVADYTHLTALMAPRPTLLTYNAKDECCFEAGYALPPLLESAGPIFKLYGKEAALRSHVNHDPGTHNYEKDNRQAFYRMLGDHFFAGKAFDANEIECSKEVKTKEELAVELPAANADFHTLALSLSKALPRTREPADRAERPQWLADLRKRLRETVRAKDYPVRAEKVGTEEKEGLRCTRWKLKLGDAWTTPAVELCKGQPKETVILIGDAGRKALDAEAGKQLAAGKRVLVVDLFYFGECGFESRGYLWALLTSAVGDRPLGIQASQLAAVARWSMKEHGTGPVRLIAAGRRTGVIALVAAAIHTNCIEQIESQQPMRLKNVIDENRSFEEMPELFCFGLLQLVEVPQLTRLAE